MRAALALAALSCASALRPLPPAASSRRRFIRGVAAGSILAFTETSLLPAHAATVANAADMKVFTVRKLAVKAKALRQAVRAGGASSLPRVQKERAAVLGPLQAAMASAAPGLVLLPAEELERAKLLPLLLKGHLLELEQAVGMGEAGFAQYTSKSTGDSYPGGKAERELEEVSWGGDHVGRDEAIYVTGRDRLLLSATACYFL